MSVTTYAILGFAMMLILTAVLVSGKFTPSIPMIVIPIIFAVIMHPTFADLSDWVTSGLKGQVSNAAMFTFAIIFFGVMMDAGVFDKIVGKMMLGAKTVTAVCVLTVLATIVGHSDGSGATTFLIVIPPFLMIYKRLKMRPIVLMCLVSITAGVMNCLPWGGPCGRLAAGGRRACRGGERCMDRIRPESGQRGGESGQDNRNQSGTPACRRPGFHPCQRQYPDRPRAA